MGPVTAAKRVSAGGIRTCRVAYPTFLTVKLHPCWLLSIAACAPPAFLIPPPPPPPPVFDLANLWLEQRTVQQRAEASERQQAALAALPWRRPLAADFLRCMEANLDWAAQFVARSPLRPPRLPPSLDGRFSFTAEVCTGKRLHGQRGSACTDALPWHAAVCSPSSKYRYQPCPACVPCL